MSKEQKTADVLIQAALDKVNRIRAGNVFAADLEAARIIQELTVELKTAQRKIEKQKKLIKLYKLYIDKRLDKQRTENVS